ncbi:MAG: carbon storage regulator CsrA [Verrucomicrobia bacterium]|nr:carbon storage regulator CsrA [Verrucomicrobiota bacterium]
MLVLSRKTNESIVIDGRITINVLRVEGEVVKLGITAPKEIHVLRKEVYDEIQSSNMQAVGASRSALERLLSGKKLALQTVERVVK